MQMYKCSSSRLFLFLKNIPVVAALIFTAKFTAASKKSATLAKSSSANPLDVRAGVPVRLRDDVDNLQTWERISG
jgi:hypothetical protein